MQGLWVAVTTKDHPFSYDAATGPVTESERFNIGAVISWIEGDDQKLPPMPAEDAYSAKYYRWIFYAGATAADFMAKLPADQRDDETAIKGNLRLINDQKSSVRPKADIAADVRQADKRTIMDRLLGR